MNQESAPTSVEVQGPEERLATLRADLAEEQSIHGSLEGQVQEAFRSGEGDPDSLIDDQSRSEARIRGMEGAIRDLEEKIQAGEAASLLTDCEAEIRHYRKVIGGLSGQHLQNIKTAHRLLNQLKAVLGMIESAPLEQAWVLAAIRTLSERNQIPLGAVRTLPHPDQDPETVALRERVDSLFAADLRSPKIGSGRSFLWRAEEITKVLQDRFGMETKLLELIQRAGPSQDELRREREADQKQQEREAKAREALAPVQGELATARAHPKSVPLN